MRRVVVSCQLHGVDSAGTQHPDLPPSERLIRLATVVPRLIGGLRGRSSELGRRLGWWRHCRRSACS